MITPGFHHIAFVISTRQRTEVFYGDVLGLVAHSPGSTDEGAYDLLYGDAEGRPGSLIGFHHDPDARRGHWGVGGIHHLALTVSDREQQLRWKRRLTDFGVQVTGPYDRGYFHSIYFADPDGHILEIATEGPGYDFDEPADALGTRFIRPDPERLRGERDERSIRSATHPEPVDEIDDALRLRGIHHITGITDDLDAAHHLYDEGLGLHRVKRTVNQDDGETRHDFWARWDGNVVHPASAITHFGWPTSEYWAREGTGQTRHIAFRAGSDTGLDRWADHLTELGFKVEAPIRRGRFRTLPFVASDGLRHEIVEDEAL